MSSYYLLPANLNFKKVETIPVDTKKALLQSFNGVEAADKIQNLNVVFYNSDVEVPSTITTTVSQILAQDPDVDYVADPYAPLVPAYRVHVNGWTNTSVADPLDVLTIVGGFPRSTTSNQMVNISKASVVLPQGTLTCYAEGLPGDTITPEVVILSDSMVTLTDIPDDTHPTWTVALDTPYPVTGVPFVEFDFSFNLFIQPQFLYA